MQSISGQKIIFLPGIDGTGISFEPLGQVLPKDADVKIIRYPPDELLDFEETVLYVKKQIQNYQDGFIVIAESFSGPVPCLYIQATSDRSVPSSSLLDFIEAVPDLRVKRIKGPHFILQARPRESLSAIRNFVVLITNQP